MSAVTLPSAEPAAPGCSAPRTHEGPDNIFDDPLSFRPAKPFFPDTTSMFLAYARRMSERYPWPRTDECDGCGGRSSPPLVVQLEWRGMFHSKRTLHWALLGVLAGGHMHGGYEYIDFTTHHCLCEGCAQKLTVKRWLEAVIAKVLFAMLFFGLLLGGLAFVLGIVSCCLIRNGHDLWASLKILGLAATLLSAAGIGWWGTTRIAKWVVPPRLRYIAKFPFKLAGNTQLG